MDKFIESAIEQVAIYTVRTLASLRDSLLPRLMKGEVRVKDVE
jgi:hypothetical protein